MVSEDVAKGLTLGEVYIPRTPVANRELRELARETQCASKKPSPSFNYGCEEPGEKNKKRSWGLDTKIKWKLAGTTYSRLLAVS